MKKFLLLVTLALVLVSFSSPVYADIVRGKVLRVTVAGRIPVPDYELNIGFYSYSSSSTPDLVKTVTTDSQGEFMTSDNGGNYSRACIVVDMPHYGWQATSVCSSHNGSMYAYGDLIKLIRGIHNDDDIGISGGGEKSAAVETITFGSIKAYYR